MNIERGAIKTIFCDYPLSEIADNICSQKQNCLDMRRFIEFLPNIQKWKEVGFNTADYIRVNKMLYNKFERYKLSNITVKGICLYVCECLDEILSYDGQPKTLKVNFKSLLRWRDLTLHLGEDLLTCTYLANKEKHLTSFCWPEVLPHDEESINQVLQRGLSDVHAHYSTSADVSNVGWIMRMNDISDGIDDYNTIIERHALQRVFRTNKSYSHDTVLLSQWIRFAACIRIVIYVFIYNKAPDRISNFIYQLDNILSKLPTQGVPEAVWKEMEATIDAQKNKSAVFTYDNSRHYDYAIPEDNEIEKLSDTNPFVMLWGERQLIYKFQRMLYKTPIDEATKRLSPYYYLYLRIKEEWRKQLIMNNNLNGLSNYNDYAKNITEITKINDKLLLSYIYQSSKWNGSSTLEIRTNYNKVKGISLNTFQLLGRCFKRQDLKMEMRVVHNVSKEDADKYSCSEMSKLYETCFRKDLPLVGIDFSGSDTILRPEVLAKEIRKGFSEKDPLFHQLTYHVGEDFYDIVDGLRAINDVLDFLDWKKGCRLSHCLALATDAGKYYKSRGYYVIAPRQIILDNLVFLYVHAPKMKRIREELRKEVQKLYDDSSYSSPFDIEQYIHSIVLRRYIRYIKIPTEIPNENEFLREEDKILWSNDKVKSMLLDYARPMYKFIDDKKSKAQNTVRREFITYKMPQGIEKIITNIQRNLMRQIKERDISIESCPSSNLTIGYFRRYDELPVFKFLDEGLKVTVCTDIKGVLGTSIENEYSLLAIAKMKSGEKLKNVIRDIDKLASYGRAMQFDIPKA